MMCSSLEQVQFDTNSLENETAAQVNGLKSVGDTPHLSLGGVSKGGNAPTKHKIR